MHYVKNNKFIKAMLPVVNSLAEQCFNPKDYPDSACSHCSLNCGHSDKHDEECILLIGQRILINFVQIDSDLTIHYDYKKNLRTPEEILNIQNSLKVSAFLKHIQNHLHFFIQKGENDPSNEGICCVCTIFQPEYDDHAPDCEFLLISDALIQLLSK